MLKVSWLLALAGTTAVEAATVRAYDVYARPGRMVDVGSGRRLNLRCSGSPAAPGRSTVIFESGLGFPSYSWRKVQPAVAKFARACSYDRAGLGFSDAGPLPRTAAAIASDLERLVDAAGMKPPFVLVGSSLGSQSVRLFAFRRPSQVSALLLVDPYVEGQYAEFDAIAPGILAENDTARRAGTECRDLLLREPPAIAEAKRRGCLSSPDPQFSPRMKAVVRHQLLSRARIDAAWSESDNLDRASERELRVEQHPLGDMPIVVLSAGRDFAGQGYSSPIKRRLLAKLAELHGRIANLSTRGRVILVPGADHVIQASHPSAVIDAIRTVTKGSAGSPLDAYVRIPAGNFQMGCVPRDRHCEPNEAPRHLVTLTHPFWMARAETTVGQFRRFEASTGYRTLAERIGKGRYWRSDIGEWDWIPGLSWRAPFAADQPAPDDWPALQVSWSDADAYCRWAGGRLPTEAEWERAARGGVEGKIHVWGDDPLPVLAGQPQVNGPDRRTASMFRTFAHFADYDDGFARVAPVMSFPTNGYGLYDMAGNAYEWTADWNDDKPYVGNPATDPGGPKSGTEKAVRGAGWGYPPDQFRMSFRGLAGLDFWTATFGFRCVRSHAPE